MELEAVQGLHLKLKGHQPEVNNNYDKEIIFYTYSGGQHWHTITSYS